MASKTALEHCLLHKEQYLMQVEDELCQILNGVDVVVGWGRNEGHARLAPSEVGDVGADLFAWQLPTLT